MFVAVSDEAGDTGVTYKGGTKSLIIGIAFLRESDIFTFNKVARFYSRPYLTTPLRKWSDLKGEIKNDPDSLYNFYFNVVNNFIQRTNFLAFSFYISKLLRQEIILKIGTY